MATKRIECHKTELSDVQHYSLSKGLIYYFWRISEGTIDWAHWGLPEDYWPDHW